MSRYRILVVDDETFTRDLFINLLEKDEYEVVQAAGGREAIEKCQKTMFDVILLDLKMPGMTGLEALREIRRMDRDAAVLIMTGHGTVDSAVEAMKLGAEDYLTKPFDNLDELKLIIERVIGYKRLREENRFLKTQLKPGNIIGNSPEMQEVYEMIHKVAPLNSTIFITGESGTGKELVARTIHDLSPRSGNRFVGVNCGGLPETLLESTLFGHEKGAFTGAIRTSRGYFEEANGGTLFLDEIGDMSPSLQVRLLRVLQERTFERVGGTSQIQTDVRIITATNMDLSHLVETRSFRKDLYYRINVINIALPPLRNRRDDIPLLAVFFLKKYSSEFGKNIERFTQDALDSMMSYPWPGNIRELENVIERAVALEEEEEIQRSNLTPQVIGIGGGMKAPTGSIKFREAREQFEREYIIEALRRTRGNITRAAKECGLARQNLHKKILKHGINIKELL